MARREEDFVVEEGLPAPDFTLLSDAGEEITLSSFRGQPVVLYFYPKDNTSGCTTQACGIRDAWSEFEKAGAVVLGVSPDGVASHQKFKGAFDLPFTLLADPEHTVSEAYGVWQQKSRYGRTYMGIVRSTFVIGPDGNVVKVMRNVQVATHTDDVLAILAA
jgi:peroxiredoxin Q/BCP